jgi:sec-independent protein translocase protein TatC
VKLWRSRPALGTPPPGVPGTGAPVGGVPGGVPVGVPAGGDGQAATPAVAGAEMPFLDHLEELRWHVFKALAGVAGAVVVCLFFAEWIIDRILLAQTRETFFMYDVLGIDAVNVVLQNRSVTGQFFTYYGTVLASALVVGSPFIVYQIWKFIEPGLYPAERKGVRFASVFATFFFALGIAFGYLVISPLSLQFFANFVISPQIVNEFDISRYFSMLITATFGAGLLFELPVVVFVLAKLGVVTTELLTKSRRYALVIVLIVAAVVTPSTDPLSLIIMALPLLLLYELGIVLTRFVERGKKRDAAKAEADAAAAIATGAVVVAEAPGEVPPVSRPE